MLSETPQTENHEGGFLKLSKKKKNQQARQKRVEGGKEVLRSPVWLNLWSLCFVLLFLFCFSLEEIKVLCWLKISVEKKYFNFGVEG